MWIKLAKDCQWKYGPGDGVGSTFHRDHLEMLGLLYRRLLVTFAERDIWRHSNVRAKVRSFIWGWDGMGQNLEVWSM